VRGRIRDRDGGICVIVESPLSKERKYDGSHADVQEDTVHFVIAPKALGETLDASLELRNGLLPVGIGRVLDESILDSEVFEYSQAEYIAVGYLRFVNPQSKA